MNKVDLKKNSQYDYGVLPSIWAGLCDSFHEPAAVDSVKIVVIGGGHFVDSRLVARRLRQRHEVTIDDVVECTAYSGIPPKCGTGNLAWVENVCSGG